MVSFTSPGASHRQNLVTFGFSILALVATLQAVSAASVHGVHRHRGLHVEVENTTLSVDTEGTFGVDAEVDVNDNTPSSSYWLETIEKRGVATFNNASSTYKVFRNVRDYGAKGDGVTDDTNAINAAIQEGARCMGGTCDSSTVTPAVVYFPPGTYSISSPIIAVYYSQLIGDPTNRPTIKGTANFTGLALIDADPYIPGGYGAQWYTNQNNFFRIVRNFILDTTGMTSVEVPTGIHWQVAQATTLQNIHFEGSQNETRKDRGIFMENGSGGFMSDLSFNGGNECAFMGNQQFMTRNFTFTNCKTAIMMVWNWQWTFKSVNIQDCGVGIDISSVDAKTGSATLGSMIVLDSSISNTPIGIRTNKTSISTLDAAGTVILDNVQFNNVPKAVFNIGNNATILSGEGDTTIDLWGQGRDYSGGNGTVASVQGVLTRNVEKPATLLTSGSETIFERTRPHYEDEDVSNFVSVKELGAKGDGVTDDTEVLRTAFKENADSGKIIYFDHGVYIVSDTVFVPTGTRVVGEAWSVIMANGDAFKDVNNPIPVFQVGNPGDVGTVEMSDLLFQTKGPQIGAVLLEWNSADPEGEQGVNAMWDVHFRVGGSAGTDLNNAECLANELGAGTGNGTARITTPNTSCFAAFMLMHIGKTASVYMENVWAWTSDHALDAPFNRVTLYNARGIYAESEVGPVWMYGVASEHNVLYQYQFQNTSNVFMAVGQTETPYYQSNPVATGIFPVDNEFNDPTYETCTTASCRKSWGLRILESSDMLVYGAGLYSFFEDYSTNCSSRAGGSNCQENMLEIQDSTSISLMNINTIGVINMVTLDGEPAVQASDNRNSMADTLIRFDVV
ncbi:exo-beta-1,3-glucanase [Morchella conica CCBAS932]|uniref:Exo-beta-1,3-glucanase n=1 Tax=Morchella conica CCBAS932 TaxID=1392247 RepID=A0A3N4KW63_9PEZI|nr:exo-beta-1,3-glucanase [Morchella conica CCBAS932]